MKDLEKVIDFINSLKLNQKIFYKNEEYELVKKGYIRYNDDNYIPALQLKNEKESFSIPVLPRQNFKDLGI